MSKTGCVHAAWCGKRNVQERPKPSTLRSGQDHQSACWRGYTHGSAALGSSSPHGALIRSIIWTSEGHSNSRGGLNVSHPCCNIPTTSNDAANSHAAWRCNGLAISFHAATSSPNAPKGAQTTLALPTRALHQPASQAAERMQTQWRIILHDIRMPFSPRCELDCHARCLCTVPAPAAIALLELPHTYMQRAAPLPLHLKTTCMSSGTSSGWSSIQLQASCFHRAVSAAPVSVAGRAPAILDSPCSARGEASAGQ